MADNLSRPEAIGHDVSVSNEAIAWLGTYALGIRQTGYNIEPDVQLGQNRWRFNVDDTEITLSIPISSRAYPDVTLLTARTMGFLDNGSLIQWYEKFPLNNRSGSRKQPKYHCQDESVGVLLDRQLPPPTWWLPAPRRELIGGISRANRRLKKDTDITFRGMLDVPERLVLNAVKWKELHYYLREAIDLRRARQSIDKN